jgi:hypothetical protein
MGQAEQWVILAEEAAQQSDPEKLMESIKALTEALDAKASPMKGDGRTEQARRGITRVDRMGFNPLLAIHRGRQLKEPCPHVVRDVCRCSRRAAINS